MKVPDLKARCLVCGSILAHVPPGVPCGWLRWWCYECDEPRGRRSMVYGLVSQRPGEAARLPRDDARVRIEARMP